MKTGYTKVDSIVVSPSSSWDVSSDGNCITYTSTGPGKALIVRSGCPDVEFQVSSAGFTIEHKGTTAIVCE